MSSTAPRSESLSSFAVGSPRSTARAGRVLIVDDAAIGALAYVKRPFEPCRLASFVSRSPAAARATRVELTLSAAS